MMKGVTIMLFKWFIIGAIPGFILGIVSGAGFGGAIFGACLTGAIAVVLRKWIFRTFWG